MLKKSLKERFEEKYIPAPNSSCWLWTASILPTGYGQFRGVNSKMEKAHRVSYQLYKGKIPKDSLVCHTCDNPSCVNPNHLFLGSPLDNMLDKVAKGRQTKGELAYRSKLKEKDILYIRNSKISNRKLAKIFGVYHQAIGHVKSLKSWRHI